MPLPTLYTYHSVCPLLHRVQLHVQAVISSVDALTHMLTQMTHDA